jgi:hypothetical protein
MTDCQYGVIVLTCILGVTAAAPFFSFQMWLQLRAERRRRIAAECEAETGKHTLAIISELYSAIETCRLHQTNDFVENARERARDFLAEQARSSEQSTRELKGRS